MKNQHSLGVLAVLLGATIWSTGGLCIKLLPYDPYTILFYRAIFAALTFLLIFRQRALVMRPLVLAVGLQYAVLAMCFVIATKTTTAANAVLLQYTAPIYVFILEPILFKFKLTPLNVITIIVCSLGMLLFFAEDLGGGNFLGNVIGLCSGVVLAAMMLTQRYNKPEHYDAGLFWGNVFIALICSPWYVQSATPSLEHWSLFAFLGVIQIGIGYMLFNFGLKRTLAIESVLLAMMEPILNPLWVFIGYGEKPGFWTILGGSIILGMLAVQVVLSERNRMKAMNGMRN
jgi:drug/metabolite transporter (DMT)-like permease